VKFSFFHLMPYPYLPDDFDTAYESSALTYPNANFSPQLGAELYARYLDELEYADKLGFDGIAINEHHQTAYGLMPSPNLMAAALTRRTSQARIMVLGNAIGIRGNPLRVAEEIAMLDLMSGGRVDSGFVRGIGWEYFGHSVNPTKSRSRFNEAHDLIIKAWTSPEMFSWYGENYEYRYVNLWPRPLQQPHPPIYIPGAGSTETMKFCAERRYTYMSVYAPTTIVRRWFDGYRQAAADLGYVADPDKIAFSVPVYVADTDEQAHAEARPAVEWLYQKGLKQTPEMVTPPGYMSPGSLRGVLASGFRGFGGSSYEELLAQGQAVVGSPASVAERFGQLYDELGGFGQIIGLFAIGPSSHEQVMRSAELFATEVMPVLRPLGQEAAAVPDRREGGG
jgi:alkanesulfonate monooxygenase SsuD/methylene tetrahydromethanopterin reductase-like flavin-dependent oxidoreductase (luciferase family)